MGAASQTAQTLVMNITSLPAEGAGANYRVLKQSLTEVGMLDLQLMVDGGDDQTHLQTELNIYVGL